MPNTSNQTLDSNHERVYQIRIKGHLDTQWSDWFEGMNLQLEENGETLLTGPVVDQAALHGLLRKVRDLGLTLLSIMRVDASDVDTSDPDRQRDERYETEDCA